jgi:hypothetical protein
MLSPCHNIQKILSETHITMTALNPATGVGHQRSEVFHQDQTSVHTMFLPKTPAEAPE